MENGIPSKEDLKIKSEQEYLECLTKAEIAIFMDADEEENPKSIFVVAQPGAGKTALKTYVLNTAQNNGDFLNYVEMNPDEVATHHSHYKEIIRYYPDDSYKMVQEFVRPAADGYLRPRAVQLRCNILQEGTFGSTKGYIDIINFQKNGGYAAVGLLDKKEGDEIRKVEGGYSVDINVFAVDRFTSLFSCFDREQYFIDNHLPPRAVTIENHDRAYGQMVETIKQIETFKLYDGLKIYKRGKTKEKPELVYSAGDATYRSATEALLAERERQRRELFDNSDEYLRKIAKLRQKVDPKNESLLNRIAQLENEFMQELEKYNKAKEL